MYTTNNEKDKGSLKVGVSAGDHQWEVGQLIRIAGENKTRRITFVMAGKSPEKTHLCFKGQGELPLGEVSYEIVDAEAA